MGKPGVWVRRNEYGKEGNGRGGDYDEGMMLDCFARLAGAYLFGTDLVGGRLYYRVVIGARSK